MEFRITFLFVILSCSLAQVGQSINNSGSKNLRPSGSGLQKCENPIPMPPVPDPVTDTSLVVFEPEAQSRVSIEDVSTRPEIIADGESEPVKNNLIYFLWYGLIYLPRLMSYYREANQYKDVGTPEFMLMAIGTANLMTLLDKRPSMNIRLTAAIRNTMIIYYILSFTSRFVSLILSALTVPVYVLVCLAHLKYHHTDQLVLVPLDVDCVLHNLLSTFSTFVVSTTLFSLAVLISYSSEFPYSNFIAFYAASILSSIIILLVDAEDW